jgi:hypothetical protein
MICVNCNSLIESERLEVLPNTRVCSCCAKQGIDQKPKLRGVMVYTEKTNGFIEIHSSSSWERNKKYYIANGARSAVKNFSKNVCA